MAAVSQIDICNRALAHLPASPIVSIGEDSLEARECRRFYQTVIDEMLDAQHDWSFANTRVTLAQLATNDRENEWLYAYQLPGNMGSPLRVLPDLTSAGIGLPVPLAGDPYMEAWAVTGSYIETSYIIEGSTLYSNNENAVLEYTINDIAGLSVSPLVIAAVALSLGAKLAVPVKKDSRREAELMKLADSAWQYAIADDRNRHPTISGQYVSEAMMARRGYLTEMP
jgi:hypothetical protein